MHAFFLLAALLAAPITPGRGAQVPDFILSTGAAVDASACCRPDGTAHAPATFVFAAQVRQVKPQFRNRNLRMLVEGYDCIGISNSIFDRFVPAQTFSLLVMDAGPAIMIQRFDMLEECPVGFLARSLARFWSEERRDDSGCVTPCPECQPYTTLPAAPPPTGP